MKYYSYRRILDILEKDFQLALMKSKNSKREDVYDVINARGHVVSKSVSLDTLRIALTHYDYPTEE